MSFTQFQTTDRVIDDRMNLFGNELISQITKYSTYDLYLKQANLMNTQKPTGAGSLITFANVTGTEQLAFTFNYAIPEQLIISRDNRYNMVIPFEGLESNRSYIFRYVYTHEGTTIFDITRNAVTASTGKFTAEFQALNQSDVDIIAEANSTVTLRIYVRTVSGTDAQISLLVNDVNALGRLSRNEATAVITTDNVYEGDKTQETINAEFALGIGQIADERGYITTKEITDLNTAKANGKYGTYNGLNQPLSGGSTWAIDVSVSGTVLSQIAKCVFGAPEGRMFSRFLTNDGVTWSSWIEIATTESYKLQASDMLNGWTFGIDGNDLPIIIKSGKLVTINALLKAGVVSNGTPIFSIPERFLPSVVIRNNFYKTASLNYAEFTIIQGGLKIYNQDLATNDIIKISMSYSIE